MSRSIPNTLPGRAGLLVAIACVLGFAVVATTAPTQSLPAKPRLAIRSIEATPAVLAQARADGQIAVLEQVIEGVDSLLTTSLSQTGRFDIVARQDLADVIREQDLAESGNVDPNDPQAARPGQLAGSAYLATVVIENFQQVTQRATFSGQFGESESEKRAIELRATMRVYNSTSGVLLASVSVPIDTQSLNERLPGVAERGNPTETLVGETVALLTSRLANEMMDWLAPARVAGCSEGLATLNRGLGAGVAPGQIWQVFHPGAGMTDPDTGEDLGAEEIPIGWLRIEQIAPRMSRGVVIQDFGIARGDIARLVPAGLPPGVDPDARVRSPRTAPAGPAPVPQSVPVTAENLESNSPPVPPLRRPVKLALFVQDVAVDVPEQKIEVLQSALVSTITSDMISVIPRQIALNAVSGLATFGADRGTLDSRNTQVERLLSDQASALALARTLGADGVLLAVIESYNNDVRRFRDPKLGVETNVVMTNLTVAWSLYDGEDGASLEAGGSVLRAQTRETEELQRSETTIDRLLRNAAVRIGPQVQAAIANAVELPSGSAAAEVPVRIGVEILDMTVPSVVDRNGEWFLTAERLPLVPRECNILVDGLLVATAPGELRVPMGPHRLRIERPGVEPVDQFFVAKEGLEFTIPVQPTDAARRQWQEQAAFFESLKDDAALRENQRILIEGYADFLRRSGLILDTSGLQNLNLGGTSVWEQLLLP